MKLKFNHTERYILEGQGGFSRQLISYWENRGSVPSKHLLRVSELVGRSVESLLGKPTDARAR